MTDEPVFYRQLAEWWPLVSPVADYAEEASWYASLFDEDTATILELGSGGGHNAFHLAERFDLTLVDLSPDMVAVSELLVPSAHHLVGDMRSVRLDELFDGVFVHDAIDYMVTEGDVRAALTTIHVHCRPGGIAVIVPDHLSETFEPSTDHGGSDGEVGGIRYLEWTRQVANDAVETDYVFVVRRPGAPPEIHNEVHRFGLFGMERWLELIAEAGFGAEAVPNPLEDPDDRRIAFVCRRPYGTDSKDGPVPWTSP